MTLLNPIQAEKLAICEGLASGEIVPVIDAETGEQTPVCDLGAVAVIDDDAAALSQEDYEERYSDETAVSSTAILTSQNEQATLRERGPRVRALDETPDRAGLLADLPLEVAIDRFEFETGARELSPAVLAELRAFLQAYLIRFNDRYASQQEKPELHIEITGFADSAGYTDLTDDDPENSVRNQQLSYRRATSVYYQLLAELGDDLPISAEDIEVVGAGDFAALRASGGVREDNDAYRIVTVTVR
ncbi:OmpA family protein [uncultured Erythrobacter sp.]|uniref:OmpA family protein n=1 Tax=uncultured Erythrobacter sp. TaxID=263913 RepID=UPI00260AB63C|nr:OmpA family protein [uncultured Erythrobacter sp.]